MSTSEITMPAPGTHQKSFVRRILSQRSAVVGLAIVMFFALMAICAPVVAPYDPNLTDWLKVRQAPSGMHWMGTDDLGRDVLSRVIFGAQASLLAGLIAVVIAILAGLPLGLIAGYFGGFIDAMISRCTDALLACPFLVLAIALAAFLGASLENAMIAIGISAMPVFIRLARGQVLSIKNEDFVTAARGQGMSDRSIIVSHILPNVVTPVVVQATITMAVAILAEASLAFLGLGQRPPAASWGSMLDVARQFMIDAPWMSVWPGLAIVTIVLGFNLLGDGLNDALNRSED